LQNTGRDEGQYGRRNRLLVQAMLDEARWRGVLPDRQWQECWHAEYDIETEAFHASRSPFVTVRRQG
jgi:hypothetical protein